MFKYKSKYQKSDSHFKYNTVVTKLTLPVCRLVAINSAKIKKKRLIEQYQKLWMQHSTNKHITNKSIVQL